jgi:chaperone modulatory protein CbpM
MEREDMIKASEFCIYHNIQLSFIHSLRDYGMIQAEVQEEEILVPVSEMACLEKIMRLYFELNINLEGIETITHMLERMKAMQDEIARLNNRLKAYES